MQRKGIAFAAGDDVQRDRHVVILGRGPESVVDGVAVGRHPGFGVGVDDDRAQLTLCRALQLLRRPVDVFHRDHRGSDQTLRVLADIVADPAVVDRAAIAHQIWVLGAHGVEHEGRVTDLSPHAVLLHALQAHARVESRLAQLLLHLRGRAFDDLVRLDEFETAEKVRAGNPHVILHRPAACAHRTSCRERSSTGRKAQPHASRPRSPRLSPSPNLQPFYAAVTRFTSTRQIAAIACTSTRKGSCTRRSTINKVLGGYLPSGNMRGKFASR